MNRDTEKNAYRLLRARRRRLLQRSVFLCLALLVAIGTNAVLSKTGEAKAYTKQVVVCPYAGEGTLPVIHSHDVSCYGKDGSLICTLPEILEHLHEDACFDEAGNLICLIPEAIAHEHTPECYEAQPVLLCGQEENPGHAHDESCWEYMLGDLICEEASEDHVHTEACYDLIPTLACGMEEGEGAHTHTEECMGTESVLICGLEEIPIHVHDAGCFMTVDMTPEEIAALKGEELEETETEESETGDTEEIESGAAETDTDPAEPEYQGEEGAVAEIGETVLDAIPMPAITFHGRTTTMSVRVDAPEGAFPQGTYMFVTPVVDEAVLSAAGAAVEGEIVLVQGVDISFRSLDGVELEPLVPIRVEIVPSVIAEQSEQTLVHVDNQLTTTVMEQEDSRAPEVSFESDSFSAYIVVYTKIEKTVLASDGNNYRITVNCDPASGIPNDAELAVQEILDISAEYGDYVSRTENALGMAEGTAGYIRLFDIKIVDKADPNVRYQPAEGTSVDVKIELADAASESLSVVHFADENDSGSVVDAETSEQTVQFEASGFSIYAIVDSSKRLQYNFYDGTSLLVSEYIKKQDNVLQELYDPGVEPEYGQTFIGWAYTPNETNPSKIYTIEEINEQAASRYNSATNELTEINVYAIYDEAWYLRYMDQDAEGNGIVLNVVRVRKDAADKNVTIDYTYTPEEGIIFEGWTDVSTGHTYQQGDNINLDHHVDLYVKLQGRNWLVFDSNAGGPGSGATYTPPQLLIGNEATTAKPDDPVRRGYTFTGWNTAADGSGTWWYKPDGSVNQFGNSLSADTTLYAQWEANDTDYYVVFWKQKATATGMDPATDYDYVSSEHRTEKTGETVNITVADMQKGGTAGSEYGYYFTYNAENSDTTATVDANGTTILNVYYDRREITYTFNGTIYSYSATNSTSNTQTLYGLINEEYVVLTRSGNNGRYTWSYYTYSPAINSNNYTQYYGLVNGTYIQINYYNGYGWLYQSGNNYYYYTGTRYTRSTQTYTGQRYTRLSETVSESYSGLYGSSFTDWPDLGSGMVWQEPTTGMLFPLALTEFDPQSAYTDETTATTVTFQSIDYDTGTTLVIYKQTVDGTWEYTNENIITTANLGSSGRWYPTETFTGFELDAYRLSENGEWVSITPSGSVEYDGHLDLRYARNQHNIHFISQGNHVTGRTEYIVEGVYYESDLNKYAEGGSNYYEPSNGNEGYYFAGWYADADCQIPFDFDISMPDADITVYAKWDTYRVRVVLVPTPDNAHNDEVEFANNQALSFRLDYNEQVDGTNINSSVAKRPGYKLIGWYYSPDFDPATEVHFPVLINKDTPGVDMNYQSGEDWNKYGDNDGSHDNVRGILKLYAKWELDVDENSVYVEYDVDDVYRTYDTAGMLQTTIPVDDNKYALTNNNVTFQVAEAPTEYTSGFEFYRWVLLNPDGSESDIMYNPADTASEVPSSFIYEETITDDLGNTATIKKIRLKAKFNIETEKVTTVTFNGNGGVTNDAASQESVTESYPVNKDFLMKDGDSFVREGYTLIGWAFERDDGSKITPEAFKQAIVEKTSDELIQAGIYQLGQKVAADNLEVSDENNWDPLENTVYAVWEINKYTVTVKKLVDGEAEGKTFSFTAVADGDYTLSEENASFSLADGGEKQVVEVPYGTVLTFEETPATGFGIQSVDAKQISNPDKTALEEPDYIDLGGADKKEYTIKGDTVITYTNEPKKVTVTIVKNAVGTEADKDAEYSFTVTGLTEEADQFTLYGRQSPETLEEGQTPTQENTKVYTEIPYGTVFSIAETAQDDFDTTITINNNGVESSVTGTETGNKTAEGDVTITYTNTRNRQPVSVWKTNLMYNTLTGASFNLYRAEDYNDKTGRPSTNAEAVTSGTIGSNGILTLGELTVGEYRLVETEAPAGYNMAESAIKIVVEPARVTALQGTSNAEVTRKGDEHWVTEQDDATWQIRVWNNPGVVLPQTGGEGTLLFSVLGTIFILTATIGIMAQKRRREAYAPRH